MKITWQKNQARCYTLADIPSGGTFRFPAGSQVYIRLVPRIWNQSDVNVASLETGTTYTHPSDKHVVPIETTVHAREGG